MKRCNCVSKSTIFATMIQKLYSKNNDPDVLQHIVDILNDGGIIIYPTDTMYAMGCHALKERPIERICKFKNIDPRKNNLSIICYDLSNISEYARVSNATFKLMKRNLPGPFTFVLNADSRLPKIFRNRKEVGIRVPDNNILVCFLMINYLFFQYTLTLSDNFRYIFTTIYNGRRFNSSYTSVYY